LWAAWRGAGVSDDLIISQMRNSRTVHHLNTVNIIDLKTAGVSEKIIDYMINTPSQVQSAEVAGVIGTAAPTPQLEPVVLAPGPDYLWVGGAWLWYGDRWIWHPGYWHQPLRPYGYWRHGR